MAAHAQGNGLAQDNPIPVDTITSAGTTFIEDTTDYEFSHSISVNLGGSFSFGSVDAAYQYVKDIRSHSDTILGIITLSVTEPPLDPNAIKWSAAPRSESDQIHSDDERLHQFITDNGSHYVQSIKYGYRVAVYGKYDNKVETEVKSFKAAFKASFTGGGAAGGITDTQRQLLASAHVELRAQVASGKVEPQQSILLYSFNEIYPFLEKIRSGTTKIYPGPIEAIANSYWHTLLDYPKTRALLFENQGATAAAPFGVPDWDCASLGTPELLPKDRPGRGGANYPTGRLAYLRWYQGHAKPN
jgi:hypothetical protein